METGGVGMPDLVCRTTDGLGDFIFERRGNDLNVDFMFGTAKVEVEMFVRSSWCYSYRDCLERTCGDSETRFVERRNVSLEGS
jgi:IS1 family transposase